MKHLSISVLVLLTCVAPPFAVPATDDQPASNGLEIRNEIHGFRIVRPAESWTMREVDNPADGTFNLLLEPEGTPQGTVQVAVRVKNLGTVVTPEQARDAALESIGDRSDIKIKKKLSLDVGARKGAGVIAEMEAMGQKFRIDLAYLVEGERVYNLQRHAPAKDFSTYAPDFKFIWDSFDFVEITQAEKSGLRLHNLAARCGAEISWNKTWEQAAKQARADKKLVLVVMRSLTGFQISDQTMAGPFMDPDVIQIVKKRFVALRFAKGMDAPFVPQESSYGMGPYAFGTSILVATPDGEIVGDTFSLEPTSFHDFLIEHLGRNPKYASPAPRTTGTGADRLDRVEELIVRGEYARASDLLAEPADARAFRLLAALLRRQKQGEDALAALDKARAAPGGEEAAAEILLDESRLLMRLGRFEEANAALKSILANHPGSDRIPEALYRAGAVSLRLKNKAEAEIAWKTLIAAHSENRWAWKAAADLTSTGYAIGVGERLAWPRQEILDTLGPHDFDPWKVSQARKAEKEALAYLLNTQRDNGSWISPAEVMTPGGFEESPFTVAITAICAQGLLRHLDEKGVEESVERVIAYIRKAYEEWRTAPKRPYFMDYSVYAMGYTLWFLADCVDSGLSNRERFAPLAAEIIAGIGSKQKEGGGWSYYVTSDLKNFDRPLNQSISFYTAVGLLSLLEARDAGFDVPPDMIEKAAGCLERMHNPDGTFEYFLWHDREDAPRATPVPGAAGRGAFCAMALLHEGRGELDHIRIALDQFIQHREFFAREHGKSLMHCGPHAQGSHYLMFDYANCAAAVRKLPKKERGKYRGPLLEQILGARTVEGTYIDNPMLGPHYGVGQALIAFDHLIP